MARFDGITTFIKANAIDARDLKNIKAREVEFNYDSYTRSDKIAEQLMRENKVVEPYETIINFEYKHSNDKPKAYNTAKMIHDGYTTFTFEAEEEGFLNIPVKFYSYRANVFYETFDGDNCYAEKFLTDETTSKLTKGNARDYVKMLVEEEYSDCKCVSVTHVFRNEFDYFIHISEEEAKEYELES